MLKNILKLDGAQILSKNEQKTINGGWMENCTSPFVGVCCYIDGKIVHGSRACRASSGPGGCLTTSGSCTFL